MTRRVPVGGGTGWKLRMMNAMTQEDVLIGRSVLEVDTPALLLDQGACDRNLRKMADAFAGHHCQLRPHFKNHKCTALARRQLEAGSAVGMTCAKLSEAEVLVAHGFDDVLIANQIVGPCKAQRLAALNRTAVVRVAVDSPDQVKWIGAAAATEGVTVSLLVEVDIGMGRCGVTGAEAALELVRDIQACQGVSFWGLQAFEGHTPYVNDPDERGRTAVASMQVAVDVRRAVEASGVPVQGISGGCTSNYGIAGLVDRLDELQCGTYATMDWRYQQAIPDFEIALTVLVSVISRPRGDTAICDVGLKGMAADFGTPQIKGHPEVEIAHFLSEEHMTVQKTPDWRVGDKVQAISSHACSTCNLHRRMIVHDGAKVTDVWPIEASGCLT